MDSYPAVEDHGLIGDLQTAALVTKDGTLDWFCAPRFDSPSIFGGLLDRHQAGYFQISPEGVDCVFKQLYLPGTPILITRFLSADGVGELVDFMPVAGDRATDRHRIVRMFRMVRGSMRFRVDCRPRFNYGLEPHEIEVLQDAPGRHHLPQFVAVPDRESHPIRRAALRGAGTPAYRGRRLRDRHAA